MPDPTPTQAINKRGLHVHHPLSLIPLWDAVHRKAIIGVTITFGSIGDEYWQLANELVNYLDYVVLRKVLSDHDNPVQDYEEYYSDPRVIYQLGNEANQDNDCGHWLNVMMAATARNRHTIIFSDSVGWTEDSTWFRRAAALEYARDHGHIVGLHAYGITTDGGDIYHPLTERSGWRWFGGRWEHLYGLTPTIQPDLILNEAGAGGYQRNCGNGKTWVKDVTEMNQIAQTHPYLKSFHWWSMIASGWGFDLDSIDDWIYLL